MTPPAKAPVLLVRTVPVERFGPLVESCAQVFPGHPLWALTSPNRAEELAGGGRLARILAPEGLAQGFRPALDLSSEKLPVFHAVVVPWGNASGAGYGNVLAALRPLRARHWYGAPRSASLRPLGPCARRWHHVREGLCHALAALPAAVLALLLDRPFPRA